MFYSTEILSPKSKSSLALLFYISTTNTKKVNKKEIESVNITNTITSLQHPPQPFALRLYSILIKGLVRIYMMRLKYCENECNVFFKMVLQKKARSNLGNKKKCILKQNILSEGDFLRDIEEMQFNQFFGNDVMILPVESNVLDHDFLSTNYEPLDFCNDVEQVEEQRRNKKRIVDKKIEFDDDQLYSSKRLRNNYMDSANDNYIGTHMDNEAHNFFNNDINNLINMNSNDNDKDNLMDDKQMVCKISLNDNVDINNFFICKEIKSLLRNNKKNISSSLEIARKDGTLSFIPQSSNSLIANEYEVNCSFQVDSPLINESCIEEKIIQFDEFNKGEKICFNDKIKSWNKKEKSNAFLRVLELASKGEIVLQQITSFGDINIFI
ncbi:R8 protein [Conglomerata obtusa]